MSASDSGTPAIVTRRQRATLAVACALVLLFGVAQCALSADEAPPATKVRDLDYGDVLFHYFQDDLFGALVRLEVADDFARLPNHAADAELLSGGLYLSLGMHAEAERIFDGILAPAVPGPVADRARFYLARISYQRGYFDRAEQNLAQIRGTLPGSLESERRLLASNVLMALGRFGEAAALLQVAEAQDDWLPYARFNLGVALVRAGDPAGGHRWLEAVGSMPAATEEQLSLRDRANLALGYSMLQQKSAEPAAVALARVRLQGPFSNRALLGLGWAEADANRPDRALVPWLELREGRLLDSSVQESFLAVPYAYTRLASNGQAAEQYRLALRAYAEEGRRIDDSIAAIRGGGFLDSILAAAPTKDTVGWFWQLQEVGDSPQTRYLYHLLASHEFQEGLKNYRDLRIMRRNLEDWRLSLEAFGEMVATRERATANREQQRAENPVGGGLDDLERRQAVLEQRVAAIERERDVVALGSAQERRQWHELDAVEQRIGMLPVGADRAGLEARVGFLRGTLLWDLDAAYKRRLLEVQSDLRRTKGLIESAGRGRTLVVAAAETAPRDTLGFASRIQELGSRIARVEPRLDAASQAQERVLASIAIGELEAEKRRLASYATQAQFALATLYDGATAQVVR